MFEKRDRFSGPYSIDSPMTELQKKIKQRKSGPSEEKRKLIRKKR